VDGLPHAVALGLRSGFGNDWLRIGSVKMFADGALGPRTAAMLQPYEGEASESGLLLLDAEDVVETSRVAVENGFSLAIHAIGDRANHEVLNGFEQLRAYEQQRGLPRYRHRIEHVQILHPMDHARLRQLDVIASMQPIHATSDMLMADRSWGPRSQNAYALNTVLSTGAAYAFGSDAPVESPNPFWGLHAAVTRRRHDGSPGEDGWYPRQRIDLAQALHGFTTGAAYAAGLEDRQGWLGVGCFADLIALEHDLFGLPPDDLYKVRPVATMVGGEWKWKS
jgi:predicted amidohydrolase YtcJ